MSERGWMEYGSEFDWKSNDALFFRIRRRASCRMIGSFLPQRRDAMKAAARIIGGRRGFCCPRYAAVSR